MAKHATLFTLALATSLWPQAAASEEVGNPRARDSLTLPAQDVSFLPLSIAERYYVWRDNEALSGRGAIPLGVRCRLWSADTPQRDVLGLLPIGCIFFDSSGRELDNEDPLHRLASRYVKRSLPIIPDALFEGVDWDRYATVQFAMTIDTDMLEPDVDLESGPLVDKAIVPIDPASLYFDYPVAAVRQSATGVLEIGCQIQQDLSVICTAERFDPPKFLDAFVDATTRDALAFKANPQLPDGTPAAGVRFKLTAEYRMETMRRR